MLRRISMLAVLGCASALQLGCHDDDKKNSNSNADTATEGAAATPDAGGVVVNGVSKPGEYSGYSEAKYDSYELSSQYVAVRDGTKLAMDLYRPKDASGQVVDAALPVLWMHTPYNRRDFMGGLPGETYPGAAARLVKYGYVVAVVDFRGLYASFGQNVAYNRGEWIDAARMDAYDITEWLAKQPWSTGNIGMWGCSATGGSQLQAISTAPPHLKAVFPMSCEFDAYPFGVPGGVAPPSNIQTKVPPTQPSQEARDTIATPVDADSDKTQLMAAATSHTGTIENVGYVPFRDSFASNIPERWWLKSSPHRYLDMINASGIAVYVAANWDEAMTKYGAFFTFNNLTNPAKLIVGPSTHCAWFTVEKSTGFDISVEELRFFDHWLKGVENGVMSEPPVRYYTYNAPAGMEWRSASKWPLPNEQRRPYYLGAQSLGTSAPAAAGHDAISVDYTVSADTAVQKGLSYSTQPLAADLQITGHPSLTLWVSSTDTDGDFLAMLQDVAPDGTATSYNTTGQLRASQRKLQEAPYNNLGLPWHPFNTADATPLVPGEPSELQFDLLPLSIVFKAGHSIRLVLTFAAGSATPVVSPAPTVTIYRDASHASAITLPIIEG
jgi:uncharacterized protein